MEPFTLRAVAIMKGIPEGHVMTYGQIAGLAGSPRGARQIVRILHSMSASHGLPWHRVVNARGEIAIKDVEGKDTQAFLLRQEGVHIGLEGRIDLEEYQYWPE
jgi:methylated-DNA-protein-cysteine methyltransferase related protein